MAAEAVSDSVLCPDNSADGAVLDASMLPKPGPQSIGLGDIGNGTHPRPVHREAKVVVPLTLSIIMAAFNEERTIARAIDEVLSIDYPCDIELIVIDDGSTDRTHELLAAVTDPRVMVYSHENNRGKGAALLSAAEMATGSYILPFDADLEYDPEDILRMLDPVLRGRCQVVYGARLFGYNTVYRSYRYAIGNRTLTRFTNILYDACLSDLHTCLKLIPAHLLRSFRLREARFGLDTEITASLLRAGVRPFEVPVSYFGRSHAEGKKITWRDAVACVWILLRVRLRRRPTRQAAARELERGQAVDRDHDSVADQKTLIVHDAGEDLAGVIAS